MTSDEIGQTVGCVTVFLSNALRILAMLLEGQGEIVKREEPAEIVVEPDTFVDFDNGLTKGRGRVVLT